MKVVILAGGFGTRLSEATETKPKPMVEIGNKPILWHIMKTYSNYGFNDFIILLGYKGYLIKEYFYNYYLHESNVTINLKNNKIDIHQNQSESWNVTLLETGLNTMTGGRIKYIKDYINDENFLLTYGDGVSDINIKELIEFHDKSNKKITMSAVQPPGRYGSLKLDKQSIVEEFVEKPKGDGAWMNGGYFVCKPDVLDYIDNSSTIFEKDPLLRLTQENELIAYKHNGFWACMDTLRDHQNLCQMWNENKAPWRVWD